METLIDNKVYSKEIEQQFNIKKLGKKLKNNKELLFNLLGAWQRMRKNQGSSDERYKDAEFILKNLGRNCSFDAVHDLLNCYASSPESWIPQGGD